MIKSLDRSLSLPASFLSSLSPILIHYAFFLHSLTLPLTHSLTHSLTHPPSSVTANNAKFAKLNRVFGFGQFPSLSFHSLLLPSPPSIHPLSMFSISSLFPSLPALIYQFSLSPLLSLSFCTVLYPSTPWNVKGVETSVTVTGLSIHKGNNAFSSNPSQLPLYCLHEFPLFC